MWNREQFLQYSNLKLENSSGLIVFTFDITNRGKRLLLNTETKILNLSNHKNKKKKQVSMRGNLLKTWSNTLSNGLATCFWDGEKFLRTIIPLEKLQGKIYYSGLKFQMFLNFISHVCHE